MNKYAKIVLIILIILFLSLYFSKYNSLYNENKKLLTEEAMIQYEQDLREGKNIQAKNYLPQEKNYNNRISNFGLLLSSWIEKLFKVSFRFMMKILEYLQNE